MTRHLRRALGTLPITLALVLAAGAPAAEAAKKRAPKAKAAVVCASAYQQPSDENVERLERTILCLVNAERASRGLARLRANDRLARAATGHSRDMVRRSYFDHVSLGGSTLGDRIRRAGYLHGARRWSIGENLAWGTGSLATPVKIVDSWMRSPGHRRNMLTPEYRELGVGVVLGAPGRPGSGATYTTNFGYRA